MTDDNPISPLGARAATLIPGLTEERYAAMVTVWARADAVAATGAELGVALPTVPGTAAVAGNRTVVWMGPEEWLVLDREVPPEDIIAATTAAAAAVDVTSQRIALRLRAPWARDVLAAGCAIDLHPSRFGAVDGAGPGVVSAVQTNLALATVVVMANPPGDGERAGDDVTVLVRSTFCRYLVDWLADAAAEDLRTA
ncbi:sarcosine oxidase subunit gamma [Tsukamurella asaccharolytica]|uniref:Sarcosine oxidase subunit gamma n=1 Tax=Tsukamurella asaccharolytica TaxID=2592067 RepID=A0A5C5R5H5_9ACTN|nr:sarcosine oxidase subunit gamma family protein [Tsukamurella asaccharolytica]TWS17936.1 sarcosine oxidase subunit gamma [Tsukamurella asaccharolytica]